MFLIEGPAYPENPFELFECVFDWLKSTNYDFKNDLICEFKFKVLSSLARKLVFEILQELEKAFLNNGKVIIHWYYEKHDEDMCEIGEIFSDMLKIPLKLFPMKNAAD